MVNITICLHPSASFKPELCPLPQRGCPNSLVASPPPTSASDILISSRSNFPANSSCRGFPIPPNASDGILMNSPAVSCPVTVVAASACRIVKVLTFSLPKEERATEFMLTVVRPQPLVVTLIFQFLILRPLENEKFLVVSLGIVLLSCFLLCRFYHPLFPTLRAPWIFHCFLLQSQSTKHHGKRVREITLLHSNKFKSISTCGVIHLSLCSMLLLNSKLY